MTVEHVAGIPVRNQQVVGFGRYYGVTVHTCVPADPASKGGVENAVKLAKADIVPTEVNFANSYGSFTELEAACTAFMELVNGRVHTTTRRIPAEMLATERARLHPVPADPHTVAFGQTRTVARRTPMVAFDGGSYSVPHRLLGEPVWVRVHGAGSDERIVIVHVGDAGPVEVARHRRAEPGSPAICDAHFPPPPPGALNRQPIPGNQAETAFLAIGDGAALWLKEAAAAGTVRIRVKMAHAVAVDKLTAPGQVDWALGHAAVHGRFAEGDLASILAANVPADNGRRADEDRTLAQGTAGWAALGNPASATTPTSPSNTNANNDSHDTQEI